MISTSILNSLGYERQTFVFFFVGAAALLLSVLLLPKYCGGYAYIIGLGASYLFTGACNLIFLYKKCPFLRKGEGQVRDYTPFIALFAVLPFSLLGQLLKRLLIGFLGNFLCIFLTALLLAILTAALYLALRIVVLPTFRKKTPFSTKK